MIAYDKIQKKKKLGLEFPIVMGDYEEMCSPLAVAEKSVDELLFYHLASHITRTFFDAYDKIRMVASVRHKDKVQLEDYWANAKDDFEVKRRIFSRLPLKLIRIREVIQVLDQVEEDENTVRLEYEKEKDRPI